MKLQRNSTRRTIVSFSCALVIALMALYIQYGEKENDIQANKDATASPTDTYLVNTID